MDRDEVLRRMVVGSEYMERSDITPEQREKAQQRYDELLVMLEKIDAEEKEKEEQRRNVPPEIQATIDKIRAMLIAKGAKSRKQA